MTGSKPSIFFRVCWYGVTPMFILIIWGVNWYRYEPITYGSYEFPLGAQLFGWTIALISIISIPLGAIHTLLNTPGKTFSQRFYASFKPTILDLDQIQNEYTSKTENRAEAFKKNKIDPEVVTF